MRFALRLTWNLGIVALMLLGACITIAFWLVVVVPTRLVRGVVTIVRTRS
jgi:hypothetical protein